MKKLMIISCLLLFFILSISSVYASDDLNTTIQENEYGADFLSTDNSDIVSVDNRDISLSVDNVTKYCGGPERLIVSVEDGNNTPVSNQSVRILINGVNYTRITGENGKASIALGLSPGEYAVSSYLNDLIVNSAVTILPTINASDVTKMFKNDTQYYATFRDGNGDSLANGSQVSFNINGVFYTRSTNSDGVAKLNINLNPDTYIITAINMVTGERHANNITVLPKLTENRDIVKYFRNGTQYLVKVTGNDGKSVGAGATVTFNINGVLYTRTTNASSIAKLNINLAPGDYIITAEYRDHKVSNNIKVLKTLSAKDLAKRYGTGTQFVANLLDGQGKVYSNQTVTFNINGVFYNRTTDASGNAKLNINLLPGIYIITSMHNGAVISNHVEVEPIKISINDIVNGADYIKNYYEKNGVLPTSVKAPVHKYTMPEFFYLMNKAIEQLGSSNRNDVSIVYGVKDISSSNENTVTSCLIKKSEFVNIAKDITSKITGNNQVPATVTTSSGAVSYGDYVVISSRILSFYYDYGGGLADYVTFVSNKVSANFNYGMNVNPFGLPGKNVYIDADGGSDDKKWDLARAFTAAGWNVKVGETDSNSHYKDYFNVPSNYVLINVYNGFCAGTIRELASSYIQNVLKSKNCVCVPVWDSVDWTNPDGMGPYRYGDFSGYSAKRAWDDNFSITDPSISNVAQYLASNNIKYCTYPTTEGIMYQFANGGFSTSMIR